VNTRKPTVKSKTFTKTCYNKFPGPELYAARTHFSMIPIDFTLHFSMDPIDFSTNFSMVPIDSIMHFFDGSNRYSNVFVNGSNRFYNAFFRLLKSIFQRIFYGPVDSVLHYRWANRFYTTFFDWCNRFYKHVTTYECLIRPESNLFPSKVPDDVKSVLP
jgi:hypothetical protein